MTISGIRIATVTAMHSNGIGPDYIGGDLGKAMKDAGIAGDVGLPTGYVLRFSNGLVAYLSGDTGITADQEFVVRNHYQTKLVQRHRRRLQSFAVFRVWSERRLLAQSG